RATMGLLERLKQGQPLASATPALAGGTRANNQQLAPELWGTLKAQIHEQLIEKLDLSSIDKMPREQLVEELRGAIALMLAEIVDLPLNRAEREVLVAELIDEITGLGPLEVLLRDPSISDILVNG